MDPVTVIGIDPGSLRTGWGIVRMESAGFHLVDCGLIRTPSSGGRTFSERLARIYHDLVGILRRTSPDEAAIEDVFQARNAMSALKLGQARGVAVAACASVQLPVSDYAPSLVKKTLVGVGSAEKEQVAFMVRRMLGITDAKWALDTSDALGVAITHLTMRRYKELVRRSLAGRAGTPAMADAAR